MDYREYKISRDLAWKILINEHIKELPIMIAQLCRNMGIQVRLYHPTDDNDGFSTIIHGRARIFVSKDCSPERQRFTVAHELGHIMLGHVGKYQLINREPSAKDNPIEQAANVFASRLLAPACVLWALDARSPEQIAQLCQISYQAASFRADRIALLYARGKFLSSPLEREVYGQFGDFIRKKKGL